MKSQVPISKAWIELQKIWKWESIGTTDVGEHCKHYLADCHEKQHVAVQVLNKWQMTDLLMDSDQNKRYGSSSVSHPQDWKEY